MLDWLARDPCTPLVIELGEITLPLVIRRRANARRMTLRLSVDGSAALVTIPPWARSNEAIAFARSRREWLARQLAGMRPVTPVAPGGAVMFRGALLAIEHDPQLPRRPHRGEAVIRLGGPVESLAPRLRRWLEGEARAVIADDLADYCRRAERPMARLELSGARRRWGSCSPSGVIRINWRLIMAPDAVRRSVVAHEVAHLVHFDHSAQFHALLRRLFEGDLAAANAWLKREGRRLYQPFG